MKNKLKLIIFSFVLFFSFGITALAATDYSKLKISRTLNLSSGSAPKLLYGSDAISGLKCGGKLIDSAGYTKGHIKVRLRASIYVVEAYNNPSANASAETITCTFEALDSAYYPDTEKKSISGPGTLTITANFLKFDGNIDYSFTLNYPNNIAKTVIGKDSPLDKPDKDSIKCELNEIGKQYVSVVVDSNSATFRANETIPATGASASGKCTYEADRKKYTVNVNMILRSGLTVFAHPGDGTCNFEAGWDKTDGKLDPRYDASPIYSDSYMKRYILSEGTINLPVCTPNSDAAYPLEFAGWNLMRMGTRTLAVDECAKDSKTFFQAGPYTMNEQERKESRDFVACYKTKKDVVYITPNAASIADGNWTRGTYSAGGEFYYAQKKDGLTFPKAIISDNRNEAFDGYAEAGTSCKNLYKAGDQVPSNITKFVVCTTQKKGEKKDGYIEKKADLTINLYEAKSEELTLKEMDVVKTTSCSVDKAGSDFVSAQFRNNDCIISGKKATTTPVTITYTGEEADGTKVRVLFSTTVLAEKVITKSVVKEKEGNVVSADGGMEVNEYANFFTGSDKKSSGCNKYTIGPVKATNADNKPIKIGSLKWKPKGKDAIKLDLNAHIYWGTARCDNGTKTHYVGLCYDPGRVEPKEEVGQATAAQTNDYVKEKSIQTGYEKYMENLIDEIYHDSFFRAAISSVDGKGDKDFEYKPHIAAATFALRFMSIELRDDTNNKGFGLDQYLAAYRKIVSVVNTDLANQNNGVYRMANLEQLKDYDPNRVCEIINEEKGGKCNLEPKILGRAFKYIGDSIAKHKNDDNSKKDTTKLDIKVNATRKDNIIKGSITGLKGNIGNFFTFEKYCPLCKAAGVSVKLEFGRDYNHLVNYSIKNPNFVKRTYNDFANATNQAWPDWNEYKSKKLYNEDTGRMVFKITLINASLDNIHNRVTGCINDRDKENKDWNLYLRLSTQGDGADTFYNTAIAVPINTVSAQRQILFAIPGKTGNGAGTADIPFGDVKGDHNETSNSYAKRTNYCYGGDGSNQNINGNLDGSAELDINGNGYGPVTFYRTVRGGEGGNDVTPEEDPITTIVPRCELNKPYFDLGLCSNGPDGKCRDEFDGVLFAASGCCSLITDRNSGAYRQFCADPKCTYETVSNVCVETPNQAVGTEHIKITEGKKENGDPQMLCVYENKVKGRPDGSKDHFSPKKDVAGNDYKLDLYSSNKVCNVYCKEDWDFKVPNIKNFTGINAKSAGSYFVLNHDDIETTGTRTCVTSKIEVDQFKNSFEQWSACEIAKFDYEKEKTGYEGILASIDASNVTSVDGPKSCGGNTFKKKYYYDYYEYYTKKNYTLSDGKWVYSSSSTETSCSAYEDTTNGAKVTCDHTPMAKTCPSSSGCIHHDNQGPVIKVPDKANKHKFKAEPASWDTSACEGRGTPKQCKNITVYSNQMSFDTYSYGSSSGVGDSTIASPISFEPYKIENKDVKVNPSSDDYGSGDCNETQDETKAKDEAITEWRGKIPSKITVTIPSYCTLPTWQDYQNLILKYKDDLFECQRFIAVTPDSRLDKAERNDFVQLVSSFNPSISYEYEEATYGKELNGRNKLQVDERRGNNYETRTYSYYKEGSSFDPQKYEGSSDRSQPLMYFTTDPENMNKNHTMKDSLKGVEGTIYLASCTDFAGEGTSNIKTKGNKEVASKSKTVSWHSEPGCTTYPYKYIPGANYVKTTVSKHNTYTSKYKWYTDESKDYKVLATNANEAAKLSKSPNADPNKYALYGTTQDNNIVFPIGITAKRNIYQYAFRYENVGMYNNSDTLKLGRLMGHSNSVIVNNTRTCFYEVYENLCICCGDVIDAEVVTPSGKSTYDLAGRPGQPSKLCTDQSNCDAKVKSKELKTKDDVAKAQEDAKYNIVNTTVSLNSIRDNLGRSVGSNWSSQSHYTLNGMVYVTPKGSKLLDSLDGSKKGLGDEIYNGKTPPEYSYVLTPTALADIRNANEDRGTQSTVGAEEAVKQTRVSQTDARYNAASWNINSNDEVTFTHWKSNFLQMLKDSHIENSKYAGKLLTDVKDDAICYVMDSDFVDSKHITSVSLYGNNGQRTSLYNSNKVPQCRWVDYVGKYGADINGRSQKDAANKPVTGYYRLAFK